MYADSLLMPLQVQFVAPEDVEKYGDDWFTYDEATLMGLPARTLISLEKEMGVPLLDAMNAFRVNSIFGDTCAAWLALKASGSTVTFEGFDPAIALAAWRQVPAEEEAPGKASSAGPTYSEPAAIVSLPTLPATGSSSS